MKPSSASFDDHLSTRGSSGDRGGGGGITDQLCNTNTAGYTKVNRCIWPWPEDWPMQSLSSLRLIRQNQTLLKCSSHVIVLESVSGVAVTFPRQMTTTGDSERTPADAAAGESNEELSRHR